MVTQTGAAGLTLGGGIGHLTRRFGATVDNVLSIDVVTMDGRVLSASEDTNADLFWGLRGAGHSLAIARSFTNQARKVGPDVMSGFLVYSAEDAVGVRRPRRGDGFLARELAVALLVLPGTPVAGAAGAHDRNPDPDGAGRLHRAAG